MLNEVKHLGQRGYVGITAQGTFHAVPGSLAAAQDDIHHMRGDRAPEPWHGRDVGTYARLSTGIGCCGDRCLRL